LIAKSEELLKQVALQQRRVPVTEDVPGVPNIIVLFGVSRPEVRLEGGNPGGDPGFAVLEGA
jgi:hypothetical protein